MSDPLAPLSLALAEIGGRIAALEIAFAGGAAGTPAARPWLPFERLSDHGGSPLLDDNTGALNTAAAAAFANGKRAVILDLPGLYRIKSTPELSGVLVFGPGAISGTGLHKTTDGGSFAKLSGERNGAHAPGGGVRGMGLYVDGGKALSSGLDIGGSNSNQPDLARFEDLRITYTGTTLGTMGTIININGTARTSPKGIRGIYLKDVEGFCNTGPAVICHGTTNSRWESVRLFTGPGGNQALNGFWFGGTDTVYTVDAQMWGCRCDGPINLTNVIQSAFDGAFYGGEQRGLLAAIAANKVAVVNRA